MGRKRVSGARCRTSATAAAAWARVSTVSMLIAVGHLLPVTVSAEVEFGWDAGSFEVGVSGHRVPIPVGSTTFTRAVDPVTCDADGDSSSQPTSADESNLCRRRISLPWREFR